MQVDCEYCDCRSVDVMVAGRDIHEKRRQSVVFHLKLFLQAQGTPSVKLWHEGLDKVITKVATMKMIINDDTYIISRHLYILYTLSRPKMLLQGALQHIAISLPNLNPYLTPTQPTSIHRCIYKTQLR